MENQVCLNWKPIAAQADDPHPSSGGTKLCRSAKLFRLQSDNCHQNQRHTVLTQSKCHVHLQFFGRSYCFLCCVYHAGQQALFFFFYYFSKSLFRRVSTEDIKNCVVIIAEIRILLESEMHALQDSLFKGFAD